MTNQEQKRHAELGRQRARALMRQLRASLREWKEAFPSIQGDFYFIKEESQLGIVITAEPEAGGAKLLTLDASRFTYDGFELIAKVSARQERGGHIEVVESENQDPEKLRTLTQELASSTPTNPQGYLNFVGRAIKSSAAITS